MDYLYSLTLPVLELTFVFVSIALLHSQRKVIGHAPLYMSLGLIFLFAQFVSAADFRIAIFNTLEFQIGPTILFLPYLAGVLLVYATEGTLAAQRLIIGSVVLYGLFLYLGEITRLESNWLGFTILRGQSASALDLLLSQSLRSMGALVLAHLADLLILPICYTKLQNIGCRRFFCVLGALFFTQIVDLLLYFFIFYFRRNAGMDLVVGSLLARMFATFWLSAIISIYLAKTASEGERQKQNALDIVFAFFGAYGKSKKLEANLQEWEGRYRVILENASEMILLLTPSGGVVDCNIAAESMLREYVPKYRKDDDFFRLLKHSEGYMVPGPDLRLEETARQVAVFKAELGEKLQHRLKLSCTLSSVILQGKPILLLIGRDITEESRLFEEKEKLSMELAHSQRMESLGQLAGGVAHDFNNYIHAILGHIDLLNLLHNFEDTPEVARHLDKISHIAEQAGRLTSQLLGFARKGKFYESELDLGELLKKGLGMIPQQKIEICDVQLLTPENPAWIKGDAIQLSQVFINLILNALDATEGCDPAKLDIVLCEAKEFIGEIKLPKGLTQQAAKNYYCVMIKDSGCGMTPEVLEKIFEPFFTTKPVGQGTGMGLSMVYGTVSNHHGFLQVESRVGEGSSFYVFIPKWKKGG